MKVAFGWLQSACQICKISSKYCFLQRLDCSRSSGTRPYKIEMTVHRILPKASTVGLPTTAVVLDADVESADTVPATFASACGAPGNEMSPANAETLKLITRIVAVQTAFIIFIAISPIRFFRVKRLIKAVEHEGGRPTAGSLNEAHHSHMLTSLQGFLHRQRRITLT